MPGKKILDLVKKIKSELGVDTDPATFRRTYAGYWALRSGAWSWMIRDVNGVQEYGSPDTVSVCIRKDHELSFVPGRWGEISADPVGKDG